MLQMRQGRYLSHLPPLPLGWSGGRPWATAQAAQQRTLQIHPRDGYVSPRPSAAFYAYQQPGKPGGSTTRINVVIDMQAPEVGFLMIVIFQFKANESAQDVTAHNWLR